MPFPPWQIRQSWGVIRPGLPWLPLVANSTPIMADSAKAGSSKTKVAAHPSKTKTDRAFDRARPLEVTVVLLERALPSTSVAPFEIFASAGVMWPILRGEIPDPRFNVRLVSIDGRTTRHWIPVGLRPSGALGSVRRTDLIVVGAAEFDLEASRRSNAPLIPWLQR